MRLWPLLIIPVFTLTAQTAKQATSTVTGHVYLADTNTPARLATVMLEPVSVLDNDPKPESQRSYQHDLVYTSAVQTLLDGSFTIPKVAPGSYYVIAYKNGYLSPLTAVSQDAREHPTKEDHKLISASLPRITIQPGLPASVEVRLERGAAISGTVSFDDGSPASGLPVHALVRRIEGDKDKWSPLRPMPFNMMADTYTDDLGHYRITGLEPREYMIEVVLQLQSFQFSSVPGEQGGSSSVDNVATLSFYSGDSVRKHDAKPFKVIANEERSGEDITIPLSNLHTITGDIAAAHDGHVLNSAEIKLLDPDDKSELESAKLDRADNKFHFFFVPEGNYILRIENPADVTYEDVPYPPGTNPPTHEVVHTLRSYGTLDQPFNVHDDIPALTIAVPDKSAALPASHVAAAP